jgi:hypothetical protein
MYLQKLLCAPRVSDRAGLEQTLRYRVRPCCLPHRLSRLNGWPMLSPANASPDTSRSLLLHCEGLSPSTPCRSRGAHWVRFADALSRAPMPRVAIATYWGAHIQFAQIAWRERSRPGAERRAVGLGESVTIARTDYQPRSEYTPRLVGSTHTRRVQVSAAVADTVSPAYRLTTGDLAEPKMGAAIAQRS